MQPLVCGISGLGLFLVSMSFMASAAYVYGSIVREINADEPVDRRIKEGDLTKTFYAVRRHSQLFPASHHRRLLLGLGFAGIISFCTFCVALLKCYGRFITR
jgi:hypothetical protein